MFWEKKKNPTQQTLREIESSSMNPDNDYSSGLFPSIIYCQEKLNQREQDTFVENDKFLVLP